VTIELIKRLQNKFHEGFLDPGDGFVEKSPRVSVKVLVAPQPLREQLVVNRFFGRREFVVLAGVDAGKRF
jgi:hypothetical protein